MDFMTIIFSILLFVATIGMLVAILLFLHLRALYKRSTKMAILSFDPKKQQFFVYAASSRFWSILQWIFMPWAFVDEHVVIMNTGSFFIKNAIIYNKRGTYCVHNAYELLKVISHNAEDIALALQRAKYESSSALLNHAIEIMLEKKLVASTKHAGFSVLAPSKTKE